MSCSITSIVEKHLKNLYASQLKGLNSDKNFSITFSSNTCRLPAIGSELGFCPNKSNQYHNFIKDISYYNMSKQKKKSPPENKLAGYNWELNTFYYLEQKFKAPLFMLNCFVESWIISCSQESHFPKPAQTQYITKVQQKLKQKHYHWSKTLQALPFPLKIPFSKEQPITCTSKTHS